jgi:YD repeat-containing protein
VDEPGTNGDLGSVASPVQPTDYEFDANDNLTKVTQAGHGVTQERVFKYDSLSRLTHERQVEAIPTLDANGVKGAADPNKWTGVYKYTPDGLLDWGVDARGVKTDLTYDTLNRVEQIEYFGETGYTTPKVVYTYSEARNDANNQPYQNNGRLTTLETLENATQGTPKTIQRYDYDRVGQVKRHRQTIGSNEYQLEYGYNLAGQLTSEKYPSGRVVNMTVDDFGVVQTVADAQRSYLNGVTSNYTATGMTSQINLGNGTIETFATNERFQLTSQTLTRGSEVLQKYNYNYGDLDSGSNLKNNGKLEQIESFIGSNKQWTQNFRYDSIGRLKEAEEKRGDTGALTYKQVFDFDRFGNLYRKAASNPTTGQQNPLPTSWIEDTHIDKNTNRFTTATGTTYNEAGQVTQDNKFREMGFGYDANGRVVKATRANTPDAHTVYDALGNRVATKINDVWQYMIYDAFGKLVAEYGVPSEGMGGVKYVQQDHQGSIRTVTNSNGFVLSRTDHQAFGETPTGCWQLASVETARVAYGSCSALQFSGGVRPHPGWDDEGCFAAPPRVGERIYGPKRR